MDIDEPSLEAHRKNINHPILKCDLSQSSVPGHVLKSADILVAGSPCQGFSTAGPRVLEDPRNRLLLVVGQAATYARPKVVIAENVPGAKSGHHKQYWDSLHDTFRGLGYRTVDLLLDSADHGVAQSRKRLFLVAWRTSKDGEFTYIPTARTTLESALAGVDGLTDHQPQFLKAKSADHMIAARIGQGQKLTNSRDGESAVHTWEIPEVFGAVNSRERGILETMLKMRRQDRKRDFGDADPIHWRSLFKICSREEISRLVEKRYVRKRSHYFDLTGTFNGKYRRLSMAGQSCTVDTRFGQARHFLHPVEHRGFTVREAARIQGFPDNFQFSGSERDRYRMIGNAVPPAMARAIGDFASYLSGK